MSPQGSDLSLEDFNGQTPLHAAARGGHAGVVTMLLQRGVDANARDKDGLSPLLLAVRARYLEMLQGLVGRGDGGGPAQSCVEVHPWTGSSPGRAGWLRTPAPENLTHPQPGPRKGGQTLGRVVREDFLEKVTSKLSQAGQERPWNSFLEKENTYRQIITRVSHVFASRLHTSGG